MRTTQTTTRHTRCGQTFGRLIAGCPDTTALCGDHGMAVRDTEGRMWCVQGCEISGSDVMLDPGLALIVRDGFVFVTEI